MFLRCFDENVDREYIINTDSIEYMYENEEKECTDIHLKSGECITVFWDLDKLQVALENSNNKIVYDLLYEDKYTEKRMEEIKTMSWEG